MDQTRKRAVLKFVAGTILIGALFASLAACGGSPLIGRWQMVDIAVSESVSPPPGVTEAERAMIVRNWVTGLRYRGTEWHFFEDGTGFTIGTETAGGRVVAQESFNWAAENGVLRTNIGGGLVRDDAGSTYRVRGSTLTLVDPIGIEFIFNGIRD